MRRPVVLLCLAALSATGMAAVTTPAGAASAPPSSASPAAVPDELVVGYVAGASESDRGRARGKASAQRKERVAQARVGRPEVESVRLPKGKNRDRAIAELESDPAVAYAEPNWIYTTDGKPTGQRKPGSGTATVTPTTGTAPAGIVTDPYFTDGSLWGMYGSGTLPKNDFGANAAPAWAARKTGSTEVVIGVIDEGIQFDHPDLDGQVSNPGEVAGDGLDNDDNGYVDDVHGWDFANNDDTVYDGGTSGGSDDHGTHVAGTIGAKADGKGVVGVNHNVTLISAKFLGASGGSLADAVKAVDYFTDLKTQRGVNVVATSNSWGGGGFSQALLDAISSAAKADILFVAAAGNSGANNDRRASYPANYNTATAAGYDAVVSVAAIDRLGALASFSQYGAKTVDLGAPGVGVWSTTAYNGYSQYNGTSMATPHVSGAAALYAAANPGSSAANIKGALLAGAVPTASLAGKTVTGGRLDANGALGR